MKTYWHKVAVGVSALESVDPSGTENVLMRGTPDDILYAWQFDAEWYIAAHLFLKVVLVRGEARYTLYLGNTTYNAKPYWTLNDGGTSTGDACSFLWWDTGLGSYVFSSCLGSCINEEWKAHQWKENFRIEYEYPLADPPVEIEVPIGTFTATAWKYFGDEWYSVSGIDGLCTARGSLNSKTETMVAEEPFDITTVDADPANNCYVVWEIDGWKREAPCADSEDGPVGFYNVYTRTATVDLETGAVTEDETETPPETPFYIGVGTWDGSDDLVYTQKMPTNWTLGTAFLDPVELEEQTWSYVGVATGLPSKTLRYVWFPGEGGVGGEGVWIIGARNAAFPGVWYESATEPVIRGGATLVAMRAEVPEDWEDEIPAMPDDIELTWKQLIWGDNTNNMPVAQVGLWVGETGA